MPKQKIAVYNPKINEYIYDRISRLTDEDKKYLSSAELNLIRTDRDLRTFCAWSTLDKKLAILTKVGIEWNISFFQDTEKFKDLVQRVYRQHTMANMRLDNIDKMRKEGIFLMGNKEVAISLAMLAQNCHSNVYFMNRDFVKISTAAANVNSPKKINALNPEFNKTEEALQIMSKVFFETQMSESYFRSDGLELVDVMILMYLFSRSRNYVEITAIQRACIAKYTDKTVSLHAWELFSHGYVDKLASQSAKPAYTITAKGVMAVGRILNRVTVETFNK